MSQIITIQRMNEGCVKLTNGICLHKKLDGCCYEDESGNDWQEVKEGLTGDFEIMLGFRKIE